MIYKEEKFDRMFTEYLIMSLLHFYEIYQNLQPPPLDFGAPSPKGPAQMYPKNFPAPYRKISENHQPPLQPRGVETMMQLILECYTLRS